ncbi:MAG: hypothetical protein R3F19_23100 [Verrucomicrobiales bacterium]
MKTKTTTTINTTHRIAATLVALTGLNTAIAQDDPGAGRQRPVFPLLGALDANHDRTIASDEIDNAPAAIRALDKDGDGSVTVEELHPRLAAMKERAEGDAAEKDDTEARPEPPRGPRGPRGNRQRGPGQPPALVKALDADGDHALSSEEIDNAAAVLREFDKDGDGQLTPEEIAPERPRGRGPRGGGDGAEKGPRPAPEAGADGEGRPERPRRGDRRGGQGGRGPRGN